jgi:hypothetical protein
MTGQIDLQTIMGYFRAFLVDYVLFYFESIPMPEKV